ncbi:hypothetical protein EC843_105118 [Buttiauxella sp. JUb87]|uniref:hypothetical protein n=1 Tax=Buttiauxella sp. JUb87 TaxID=2485129 RepID=UPI00105EEAEC|nr:hypothetical protein [Buttiauxella sp. JUb87]TDN50635.1 hypothetical protein EC843_105118 [Buttiauxella sp. JUb87]
MKVVLDCREIKDIPLIEREVSVDGSKLTVGFSLIGDLNLFFEYYKNYQSDTESMSSAERFIKLKGQTTKSEHFYTDIDFSKQQHVSKVNLLKSIISNKLDLPDGGDGFIYNGDKSYVEILLNRIS